MQHEPPPTGPTWTLAAFADQHGPALLRLAYLLCAGQTADAEDLVQAVLARLAARGLHHLDQPLAYARRAVVNEHRDQLRRTRAQRDVAPRIATHDTSTPPAHGIEDRLAILAALGVLSPRERSAVVLRYYEDLPDQQTADILGCSPATVRSLLHRATPKLRAALADTYSPPPTHTTEGELLR